MKSPRTSLSPSRVSVLAYSLLTGTVGGGCHYDLDRLRAATAGLDAGHDAVALVDIPAGRDVPPVPMDAGTDGPQVTDVPTADTGTDVPRDVFVRPAMTGTCTSHEVVDLNIAATHLGDTLAIDGDTTDGPLDLRPVMAGTGCANTYTDNGPVRVYRYTVHAGPRLVATTNGSSCTTFDTILYALTTCDVPVSASTQLACDDDDGVRACNGCGDAGTACTAYNSTVTLQGLVPGDVVYLVVAGISGAHGPFRLTVAENAGDVVAPPDVAAANHCVCAPLPLPDAGVSPSAPGFPGGPGDTGFLSGVTPGAVAGQRAVPLRAVTGLTGQFRLRAQGPAPAGCTDGRTVVDLYVQGTPVASFGVPRSIDPNTVMNVMYAPTAALMIPNQTMVPLAYRVRAFEPGTCTGGFDMDTAAGNPNGIVLYGQSP